jgi:hypothetical protein
MFGVWTPVIALVVSLLALLLVKRWITDHLQELSVRWVGDPDVALIVYFVIVLPGVIVHEVSHWLAAKLLGVRVTKLSLGPVRRGRSRRVSLGSVRVGNVDAFRASLIGLAPLLGGTAVILIIGNWVLDVDDLAGTMAGGGIEAFVAGLEQVVQVPDFWLWLYLIFSVSNAMLPSASDVDAIRPVLIFLGIVASAALIVTGVPAIPEDLVEGANAIADYLASAFGLTLAVDAVFVVVIAVLTLATRRLQDGYWI